MEYNTFATLFSDKNHMPAFSHSKKKDQKISSHVLRIKRDVIILYDIYMINSTIYFIIKFIWIHDLMTE